MSENGFKFKGLWWDEKAFVAILRRVLELHRSISSRRVAYHLGVTEKAVRDLIRRSPLAERLMTEMKGETVRAGRKTAACREDDYGLVIGEVKIIYHKALAERQRLEDMRREQKLSDGVQRRKVSADRRVMRHETVQACKRDGMTQAMAAEKLAISLSTIKRFWPEVLVRFPAKKRGRPRVTAKARTESCIRRILSQYHNGEQSALHSAQLIEAEGLPVPAELWAQVKKETGVSTDK